MRKTKKQRQNAFVLSDGTVVNSYGFKVATEGIDLSRFLNNPVMLDSHIKTNWAVIGLWENISANLEQDTLLADPVFDTEDPDVAKTAGKVERGFIKGASIGISFDKKDFKHIDGELVLTKCELVEASIVAIPSNASSLRLYQNDEEMSEDDVKELCLSLNPDNTQGNESFNNSKNEQMSKQTILLGLGAMRVLGFTDASQELSLSDIEKKVLELGTAHLALEQERDELKTKLEGFQKKEEDTKAALSAKLVDDAIKEGKITADKRDAFLAMANDNYKNAEAVLGTIPGKTKHGKDVSGGAAEMSMDDFQKLSVEEQLKFKTENPTGYAALLKK